MLVKGDDEAGYVSCRGIDICSVTGKCRGWSLTPSLRLKKNCYSSSEDKGKRPTMQRDASESKDRQIDLKAICMTIVRCLVVLNASL